jgi:hypothetical protein
MTDGDHEPEGGPGGRPGEEDRIAQTRAKVLAAAMPHVAFDGWSDKTLSYAVEDAGVDAGLARLAFPRGGIDLALASTTTATRSSPSGWRARTWPGCGFATRSPMRWRCASRC